MSDPARAVPFAGNRPSLIAKNSTFRHASENQRVDGRIKTFLSARIHDGDGNREIDCLVKDMSESGAKIELDEGLKVPTIFNLEVPKLGAMFRAEIRWRYGHLIGVKFIATSQSVSEESPTRAELLAENAALLETVRKLAERLTQLGEPVMISLAPRKASGASQAK